MRVNLKLIQVIADALIPILGYFLWGWGLFFIILYYVLDLVVSEVFMFFKSRAIRAHQRNASSRPIGYAALSFCLIIMNLLLIRLFMNNIHPNSDLIEEIIAFWNYKDMGIAQGYVLIPLVALVGFQRYKNEFIKPKWHETISLSFLWRVHLKSLLLLLTYTGIVTGSTYFFTLTDGIYLSLLLIGTSTYQLAR